MEKFRLLPPANEDAGGTHPTGVETPRTFNNPIGANVHNCPNFPHSPLPRVAQSQGVQPPPCSNTPCNSLCIQVVNY